MAHDGTMRARSLQLRAPHLLLARRSAQTLLSQLSGYITGVANGGSGGGGGGGGGARVASAPHDFHPLVPEAIHSAHLTVSS